MGIGIFIAALLRGMATVESCGTSPKEGSAEALLGPLLLEPRNLAYLEAKDVERDSICWLSQNTVISRLELLKGF